MHDPRPPVATPVPHPRPVPDIDLDAMEAGQPVEGEIGEAGTAGPISNELGWRTQPAVHFRVAAGWLN